MVEQRRIVELARQFIENNALIFDTETTGLGEDAEIIEIAIVDAAGTLEFSTLVKPSRPIPAEATAINGITNEMVESATIWASVLPLVERIIGLRELLAYNSEFDVRLVERSSRIYKQLGVVWGADCLMKMMMAFRNTDRRISLSAACVAIGAEQGHHRALSDAKAAREVLRWLARQETWI